MRVLLGELVSRRVRKCTEGAVLVHSQTFDLGEWVLITAAAGGVGMSAVQIAKGMYKILRQSRVTEMALTGIS